MINLVLFKPAEILVIRNGPYMPLKDLLKYTLLDLVVKRVVAIEEVERQPSVHDPVKVYKYYSPGENFKTFEPQPHEAVFLSTFTKNPSSRILFRNLVKVGYENARSEKNYYRLLMKGVNLKPHFTTSFLNRLFSNYDHTESGLLRKNEIEKEISQLEKSISTDKEQNRKLIEAIGGNVFLLSGISTYLADELDPFFKEEYARRKQGDCGTGCTGSYENYAHDFDNSCSTPDSSGCGNGCGGDGDSGCSGCGGCGGD